MTFRSRGKILGAALCELAIALAFPAGGSDMTAQANQPQPDSVTAKTGYMDNGEIKLGVNLDLGGAITYLSRSEDAVNVVNSYDWGRQIQMSHYSGPVPFAPNGKQPNKGWAGLGWNPIQSGDCFGNRSRITAYRNDGKTIYVRCVPMQWPLDNEPGECTFECWITLEGHAAHVRSRLTNHRADHTQYPARSQELPAVYTNGPWYRLMTYKGDKPYTEDALSEIPQVPAGSSFPWAGWQATENWAALVDARGWGLGIWQPGVYSFLGGFAGKPGAGGPKDSPTGYIAPLHEEIIDHNIVYEYRYDLILGSLSEIRGYVYAHAAKLRPPAYRFTQDRQHWRYANGEDTGWPIRGELSVRIGNGTMQLLGPSGFWYAHDAPVLRVTAAFPSDQPDIKRAIVFWKRADDGMMTDAKSLPFAVVPDGKMHTYTIRLADSAEYRDQITGLRLDVPGSKTGVIVRVKAITF